MKYYDLDEEALNIILYAPLLSRSRIFGDQLAIFTYTVTKLVCTYISTVMYWNHQYFNCIGSPISTLCHIVLKTS